MLSNRTAGGVYESPAMAGDGRVDEVGSEFAHARKRPRVIFAD
jgi:hypothetical protein